MYTTIKPSVFKTPFCFSITKLQPPGGESNIMEDICGAPDSPPPKTTQK